MALFNIEILMIPFRKEFIFIIQDLLNFVSVPESYSTCEFVGFVWILFTLMGFSKAWIHNVLNQVILCYTSRVITPS